MAKKENINNKEYDVSKFIDIYNNIDNKRVIIFGPNGTGKTTVGKEISKLNEHRFAYISISDEISSLDGYIKQDKNKVFIGVESKKINELNIEIKKLEEELKTSNNKVKLTDAKLKIIRNELPCFDVSEFENKLDCKNLKRKDLLAKFNKKSTKEYAERIQENPLQTIIAKSILDLITLYKNKQENFRSDVCEVCESKIKKIDLLKSIEEKITELQSQIVDSDVAIRIKKDADDKISNEELVELIEFIPKLNTYINDNETEKIFDKISTYSFLINNSKSIEELKKIEVQIKGFQEEIDKIRNNWNKAFLELKENIGFFEQFLNGRLGLTDDALVVDDENKTFIINLGREFTSFSSGEKNLLKLFMVLNKSSIDDEKKLILDDPFTSYDIANQFVMANLMVEYLIAKNKEFIITSHSIIFGFSLV